MSVKISVVIPVLNEADNIARAVKSASPPADIIVSDGGSTDSTCLIAKGLGVEVITTGRGRGGQMDAGAALAKGDVILFLHADSVLPDGWAEDVMNAVERGTVAGAFRLRIDSERPVFRLIERAVALRSKLFGLIYGDQAIFARKDVFFRAGGFRKLPLMEDVDCVKRLRGFGKVVLLKKAVTASSRRWDRGGVARTTLRNWYCLALYCFGVPPEKLYGVYYGKGRSRQKPEADNTI